MLLVPARKMHLSPRASSMAQAGSVRGGLLGLLWRKMLAPLLGRPRASVMRMAFPDQGPPSGQTTERELSAAAKQGSSSSLPSMQRRHQGAG